MQLQTAAYFLQPRADRSVLKI